MKFIFLILVIFGFLTLLGIQENAFGQLATLGTPVQISNFSGEEGGISDAKIDSSGNNVHVMWRAQIFLSEEEDVDRLFYSRSTDNGQTFSQPIQVGPDDAQEFELHAKGSRVFVAYRADLDVAPFTTDIFFMQSIDNGANFSPTQKLSTSDSLVLLKHLEVTGNRVYVIWSTDVQGNNVFFAPSIDWGVSFDSPVNIPPLNSEVRLKEVSASNNYLYFLYQEGAGSRPVHLVFSSNGGSDFSNTQIVSSSLFPNMISDGINVYFFNRDSSAPNTINLHLSTNGGVSFGSPVSIADANSSTGKTTVSFSGDDIVMPWIDWSNNNIMFTQSFDDGTSFSNPKIVATSAFTNPEMDANGHLALVWRDAGGLKFTFSGDRGKTFDSTSLVTSDNQGNFSGEKVSVYGNFAYVLYDKQNQVCCGNNIFVTPVSLPSCTPPQSGDWIIDFSCFLPSSQLAPGNVIVNSGSVFTIPSGTIICIDKLHHLLVKSGGGVLIELGASIYFLPNFGCF